MSYRFLINGAGLVFLIFGTMLPARASLAGDERIAAMNRQVGFANECMHLLFEAREQFERLNEAVVVAETEGSVVDLSFPISRFYRNGKLFTFLQGSCTRTSEEVDAGLDLLELYRRAQNTAGLGNAERYQLNLFREEIWSLTQLILAIGTDFQAANPAQPLSKTRIEWYYQKLTDAETLYNRFQQQVDKAREFMLASVAPVPTALRPFQTMITQGEALLYAVRTDNQVAIQASRAALQQSIELSRDSKLRYSRELASMGLVFDDDQEHAYDHAIEYGELLLQRSQPGVLANRPRGTWSLYPVLYFHYNTRLIDIYNHHKYGLTSYYRSLINHSNRDFLHPLDMPPWLKIVKPEPIKEETFAQIVEIDDPEPEPVIPPLSLDAAPVNNLVFLIDVSASMNQSDKLPLFKENLEFLVSLFRPEDKIAIVTFSGNAAVILESTPGIFPSEIRTAIRGLRTGGETKVRKGFREAYQIAEEQFIFNGTNRVVLITDGIFDTDRSVENTIENSAEMGIQLSVMLVGNREAPQVRERLEALANIGEGDYSHFREDNAREVLVKEARGE